MRISWRFWVLPNSSTESLYLLQRLARELGCNNIDHRLKQQVCSVHEPVPTNSLGMTLAELEQVETVLLIGSDIRYEQPMLCHRVRKAAINGAQVMSINVKRLNANFELGNQVVVGNFVDAIMQLAKALGVKHALLDPLSVTADIQAIASVIQASGSGSIMLGHYALEHPQSMWVRWLVRQIESVLSNHKVGYLTHGANSSGAALVGALPHIDSTGAFVESPGLSGSELLDDKPVKAYVLLNFEVENDVAKTVSAIKALDQSALVICLTVYETELMRQYADFIFPIAPYTECAGTYYNVEGRKQVVAAASVPMGGAKPAWKVLRVLAHFMERTDFNYSDINILRSEMNSIERVEAKEIDPVTDFVVEPFDSDELQRYAYTPIYHVDGVVRRSLPLSKTALAKVNVAC